MSRDQGELALFDGLPLLAPKVCSRCDGTGFLRGPGEHGPFEECPECDERRLAWIAAQLAAGAWVRLSDPKLATCHQRWQRGPWIVRHCGHPTANWPYAPEHVETGEQLVAPSGRAFRLLSEAKLAVDRRIGGGK